MPTSTDLAQQSLVKDIFQHAVNGFSIQEIAIQTGASEDVVRRHLTEQLALISADVQQLQEHYMLLSLRRTELMMSKLMPLIEGYHPSEVKDVREATGALRQNVASVLAIIKAQSDLLKMKMPDKKGTVVEIENLTINSASPLYQRAMESTTSEAIAEAWHTSNPDDIEVEFPDLEEKVAKITKVLGLDDGSQ